MWCVYQELKAKWKWPTFALHTVHVVGTDRHTFVQVVPLYYYKWWFTFSAQFSVQKNSLRLRMFHVKAPVWNFKYHPVLPPPDPSSTQESSCRISGGSKVLISPPQAPLCSRMSCSMRGLTCLGYLEETLRDCFIDPLVPCHYYTLCCLMTSNRHLHRAALQQTSVVRPCTVVQHCASFTCIYCASHCMAPLPVLLGWWHHCIVLAIKYLKPKSRLLSCH